MWMIYLAEVSEAINTSGVSFSIISATVSLIFFFAYFANEGNYEKRIAKRIFSFSIPLLVVSQLLVIVLPSKQTIYLMVAAQISSEIMESPDAKLMSDKILAILNNELDKRIKVEK